MAKIINTVGSLSILKLELEKRNIRQFHSLEEIQQFENTYNQQLSDVPVVSKVALQAEIKSIQNDIASIDEVLLSKKKKVEEDIDKKIVCINGRINYLRTQKKHVLIKIISPFVIYFLHRRINRIEYGRNKRVLQAVRFEGKKKEQFEKRLAELNKDFDAILEKKIDENSHRIKYVKETVDGLRPLILGVIGESKVSRTLSLLPDGYVVINDVYIELQKPIYYREEDDRIFSFQIDHLVIGPTGVFVVETKHWGQSTINSCDLFSPVKQIKRSNYALFRLLNYAIQNHMIDVSHSSWGDRTVSVRNILALTASTVKEKFQHVKVLDTGSLNSYIQWFDKELSSQDVEALVSYVQWLEV